MKKIEKFDIGKDIQWFDPRKATEKINELVDAVNELNESAVRCYWNPEQTQEPKCEHEWERICGDFAWYDECRKCKEIKSRPTPVYVKEKPAKKECPKCGKEMYISLDKKKCSTCQLNEKDELAERLRDAYMRTPRGESCAKACADEARKWAVEIVKEETKNTGFTNRFFVDVEALINRLRGGK